ncbi:MAG: hypothetical protein WKF82_04575 [Nocardioidaceae bacterium]
MLRGHRVDHGSKVGDHEPALVGDVARGVADPRDSERQRLLQARGLRGPSTLQVREEDFGQEGGNTAGDDRDRHTRDDVVDAEDDRGDRMEHSTDGAEGDGAE